MLFRSKQLESLKGKRIYPNAAAFTACLAEVECLPEGTELSIVLEARIPVWAETYALAKAEKRIGGRD